MTTGRPVLRLLLAALVLLAGGAVAQASSRNDSALGSNGELFTLVHGTFGELFGSPEAAEAPNPVLALEIRRPGASTDRVLVADTGGTEVEGSATLVYEESSESLFVAWESTTNIHSRIRLAAYANGSWSDPVDVSDVQFSLKDSPRVTVTRDAFKTTTEEGDAVVHRTVVHVIWVEERATGIAVVYAPLVLLDGAYTGAHAIVNLLDLVGVAPEAALPVPLAELPLAPAIQHGTNDHSVVAGFVDPRTGRLATIELSLLSGEISSLADLMRGHIIDVGSHYELSDPGGLSNFAQEARGHIIDVGLHLDPRLLEMIAGEIQAQILAVGAEYAGDLESLGGLMRGHIIDVGARLETRGLAPVSALPGGTGILDLSVDSATAIIVRFEYVTALSVPEMGADPNLYLSADGTRALIAWEVGDRLEYRESKADTWSDVASLPLTELGRDRAYEILEQRIGSR